MFLKLEHWVQIVINTLCLKAKQLKKTNENEKCFKPDISSQWSFVLLLYQLPVTKTTEKNYSLTTDSKEASYEASYESPLTRKIGLKIRNFFLCLQIFFLTLWNIKPQGYHSKKGEDRKTSARKCQSMQCYFWIWLHNLTKAFKHGY